MTNNIISLNGIAFVKDNQTKEISHKPVTQIQNDNITNITKSTELGDSLRELNKDELDPITRMSDIDMRSRLHFIEANNILALDSLVALNVLPSKCLAFTRQKKRLSVSIQGQGRKEITQIVSGKREHDSQVGSPLKDYFFGKGGNQNENV